MTARPGHHDLDRGSRHSSARGAPTHRANATVVSGLATDWYAGFGGIPGRAQNLTVVYKGKNCTGVTRRHLRGAHHQRAAADGEDLRLDGRRGRRLLVPRRRRLGDALRLRRRSRRAWARRLRSPRRGPFRTRLRRTSAPARTRARSGSWSSTQRFTAPSPTPVLDVGQPPEDRVRRAMTRATRWERTAMRHASRDEGPPASRVADGRAGPDAHGIVGLSGTPWRSTCAHCRDRVRCPVARQRSRSGASAIPSTPGDCSTAAASLPGPVLAVDDGDTVSLRPAATRLPAGALVSASRSPASPSTPGRPTCPAAPR